MFAATEDGKQTESAADRGDRGRPRVIPHASTCSSNRRDDDTKRYPNDGKSTTKLLMKRSCNCLRQAFRLLQKSRTSHHPELMSIITRIHSTVNQHLIEDVIMECLESAEASVQGSIAAFSVIWDAPGKSTVMSYDIIPDRPRICSSLLSAITAR